MSKQLFHESVFFVATSILDISQFVKMLWFMSLYYEISIVVLSLFFSAVASAFQLFTCKLCLQFSGLRMRNFMWNRFPIKICWSIPCLHPLWKVHTWIEICASLNHCKKTKADGSWLIPRKHTETLVLLCVFKNIVFLLTVSEKKQ